MKGPLAAQTPQPILTGQTKRPMFSIGPPFLLLKSWTLADGEVLARKPKAVIASSVNASASADAKVNLPQPNPASAWDIVFGQGFFVKNILGKKIGQGVFTGSKGTVLQVETLTGQTGVAIDSNGNVYKMVW